MSNQQSIKALIVEDSLSLGALYSEYLRKEHVQVTLVHYGEDALTQLKQWQPDIVLLDIKLPDMSGMDILEKIQTLYPQVAVVMVTAHGSIDIAVEAMRIGAFDFLVKPFDGKRLSITVRNAIKQNKLLKMVNDYEQSLPKSSFEGFIGESLPMQAIYKTIDSVASSRASIFIVGESGTGKEVCAHAIHRRGQRNKHQFVALNCASIPKDLIESEIFGHVKGAFTGAHTNREGAATRAHKGTLFLDEICELDLNLQSKLLRFIQTGTFQRVGSNKDEHVDVRIISATNRQPWQEVQAGRFREDLFFRLHVIPIQLPPLRDRHSDCLLLAESLIGQYAEEEGKQFSGFNAAVRRIFQQYAWPGNVRELQNVIRQIVVLNEGGLVTETMLPALAGNVITNSTEAVKPKSLSNSSSAHNIVELQPDTIEVEPLWVAEKQIIEQAIAACDGNVPKAAALLDISASTIYRKKQQWQDFEKAR
ncbi:sigma-54-dependent transcriptional regulator [Shewanella marina]|uniref:sigma-54-dependent transcriptional regulator n=1 Tax=Shewanella marina TaxID=487319 RepID=UPI00046F60BC|nr:sigma-54 dependent transcriptional regulator [Shewanella marina]